MLTNVQTEANQLIETIKNFWDTNVSDVKIDNITDVPFDMFTLLMKLYGVYEIKMIYDRSTLGINLNVDGQFVGLSKLANEAIFKGFEGYYPENLLYNFRVLDKILK